MWFQSKVYIEEPNFAFDFIAFNFMKSDDRDRSQEMQMHFWILAILCSNDSSHTNFYFVFFYRGSHYSMDSLMTLQGLPPPPAAPPVERMLSPELETVLPPPSQFHTLPRLHRW